MRNFLHEWRMRRKIKAILAYNKKHSEECFNLSGFIAKEGIQPGQGDITAESMIALVKDLKAMYGGDSNV